MQRIKQLTPRIQIKDQEGEGKAIFLTTAVIGAQ